METETESSIIVVDPRNINDVVMRAALTGVITAVSSVVATAVAGAAVNAVKEKIKQRRENKPKTTQISVD